MKDEDDTKEEPTIRVTVVVAIKALSSRTEGEGSLVGRL